MRGRSLMLILFAAAAFFGLSGQARADDTTFAANIHGGSYSPDIHASIRLTAPTPMSSHGAGATVSATVLQPNLPMWGWIHHVDFYADQRFAYPPQLIASFDLVDPFVRSQLLSFQWTAPSDGFYTVSARAEISSGIGGGWLNVSADFIRFDATGPSLTVSSPAEDATISGLTRLSMSTVDDGGTVDARFLDENGDELAHISAPGNAGYTTHNFTAYWNSTERADGPMTITAEATDAVGNVTSSQLHVTVDNSSLPPSTAPPQIDWYSPADGATVRSGATFTFEVSDPDGIAGRLDCIADGSVVSQVPTPGTSGGVTCPVNLAGRNGPVAIQLRASDIFGNTTTSAARTFTVDNDTPTARWLMPFGSLVGSSFIWALEASAGDGITRVDISENGEEICSFCSRGNDGTWQGSGYAQGLVTSGGTIVLQATVYGHHGVSITITKTLTADYVAPSLSLVSAPPDLLHAPAAITTGTVEFVFAASDDVGPLRVESLNGFQRSPSVDGRFHFLVDTTGFDGQRTFSFRAVDAFGNVSGTISRTYLVVNHDTVAPEAGMSRSQFAARYGRSATWTAYAYDDVAVKKLDCLIDGVVFATASYNVDEDFYTCRWQNSGAGTVSLSGPHTISVTAVDYGGNEGTDSVTINIDAEGPPLTLVSPAAGLQLEAGLLNVGGSVGVDPAGNGATGYTFDGGATVPLTVDAGAFADTIDVDPLGEGTHTIVLSAADLYGNVSTLTRTFTVDRSAPSVQITAPSVQTTLAGTVTLSADASDTVGVAQLEFLVDGSPLAADTQAPYTAAWDTGAVSDGQHTITVVAIDPAGHTAQASLPVTVKNAPPATDPPAGNAPTPPTGPAPVGPGAAPAPADTVAPTTPGKPAVKITGSRIRVSFGPSTDNVAVIGYQIIENGTPTTTISGTSFQLPARILSAATTMTVVIRAIDAAGNLSEPVTLTLTITRLDPPRSKPQAIPGWAWRLDTWQHQPKATRGKRPTAPQTLPAWFRGWSAWHRNPVDVTVG